LAQRAVLQPTKAIQSVKTPASKTLYTGFEQLPNPVTVSNGSEKDMETEIGTTVYDLQTNSAVCNRISMTPDGRIAATWTLGNDDVNMYPDRGTGYNTRVDFVWGDNPTGRLEDEDTRTGWGNHVFTATGGECIVSHSSASELITLRRDGPTDAWTQSVIPSNVPAATGSLWPRAAVGGADGQSVHVIAITTPAFLEGEPYQGVDGHILYHRSSDGGATWDQVDVAIDGLGSDFTIGSAADSYYIDARGETVAFAVFNQWDDLLLFKSEDNGGTWTKTIVNDFPLSFYSNNDGYTTDQLPPYDEVAAREDSLDIFTNDGSGVVLIDHDNLVHIFHGNMWVNDSDTTDTNDAGDPVSIIYPGTNGLSYWNEFFTNGSVTITGAEDTNGDGMLNIANGDAIASYSGSSLSSFPTAGVDAENNIYLVYSVLMEELIDEGNDLQHYRHLYTINSQDSGETWSEPFGLINENTVEDVDFISFTEAVFPVMVRDVDNKIRLIYQRDFRPGTSVGADDDDAEQNEIMYLEVDVAELGVVRTEELVDPTTFGLRLAPTITRSATQATFQLTERADVSFQLINTHGQWVQTIAAEQNLSPGEHFQAVDLSNLPRGVYYLTMKVGQEYSVVEVVKQ
ncbi:MAG: T9SS type A sorting domain-containing protein, partial [Bacteroidota bacterium]